jgi:hypothetical protein
MAKELLEVRVNGSELLVLRGCPDQAMSDDMMASTLYTQLAADHQFNKFDTFSKWQDILLNASSKFGWMRLDVTDTQERTETTGTLTPADVFGALLPASLAHWQGDPLRSLFTQLCTAPANGEAFRLLKQGMLRTSSFGDACTVVMRLSFMGPTGERVSLCLAFETRETPVENPFNQCFSRHQLIGNMMCSRVIAQFDGIRYAPLRTRVKKALQTKQPGLVLPVTVVGL